MHYVCIPQHFYTELFNPLSWAAFVSLYKLLRPTQLIPVPCLGVEPRLIGPCPCVSAIL